ncbi:MAG: EAL domain-containing protein [Pseudomonadota bacterium]
MTDENAMTRPAQPRRPAPELALQALNSGRLRLALQPVRPAGRIGAVAFEEALARVVTPGGEVLEAGAFAPELERRGHAPRLDRAALAAALALLRRDGRARISVNVSGRTLGDRGWMALLEAAAERAPEAPRRLIVELTETARATPEAAQAFRARIGAMGPAFALDDYGAGHADASQARALRPDILKLDAALCEDASPAGGARLKAALELAREIETMTVAEGVESAASAARLAAAGVDALQGRWTGPPALAGAA